MNVIEIEKLSKSYFKTPDALNALSFSVPEGSVFGVLGPNGAGKSTLMNVLAGLLRRNSGEVRIFGQPVNYGDFEYKRRIGFVLEEPHYLEKLSVKEYLLFAASMYALDDKEAQKRTDELIEFFGLKEKEHIRIQKYSKGMKKKVSLAAAMIHRPDLYILDEPLEGMDPPTANRIKENFRLMVKKGTTIIISSHILDTVERLCDEVVIINKGQQVLQSKTEDILHKFKSESGNDTYKSLEEVFLELTSGNEPGKKLSWL